MSVSREAMRELDRQTIEEWGIPGRVLMENAGRCVVNEVLHILRAEKVGRAVAQHLGNNPEGNGESHPKPSNMAEVEAWKADLQKVQGPVCVVCGPGNNGGDGFVISRTLLNHGVSVHTVFVGEKAKISDNQDAAANHDLLARFAHKVIYVESNDDLPKLKEVLDKSLVSVDALFGTGLMRPLEGLYLEAVNTINHANNACVAVDIASGLDADSGDALGAAVKADITLTFGASKRGLSLGQGPSLSGKIKVAEMGIPQPLIEKVDKL